MSPLGPPRLSEILVRLFGPRRDQEFLSGDLAEGYRRRAESDRRAARRWYRAQALAAIGRAPFWSGLWLDTIGYALRHAIRGLRSQPLLTLVAIVSLAIGIGSSTAIFSVMDRLLLRPMEVPAPEDLFQVTLDKNEFGLVTNPIWEALRDRQNFLAGVFANDETGFERVRDGEVGRVAGAWVSGDFFNTLGVGIAAGRPITPADDYRGCPAIAVLGHGFWQSEYGGAQDVIGDTIVLNDQAIEIVGVAAAELRGLTTGLTTKVYAPLCAEAVIRGRGSNLDAIGHWSLRLVARRQEGMSVERLESLFEAVAPAVLESTASAEWGEEYRDDYLAARFQVRSAARGLTRVGESHAGSLWMLSALGALVVVAACANLATLLLARGESRRREVAIQAAIGADRWRIFGQALTESVLLAALGALLGLGIAVWGSRALVTLMSTRLETVSLDLSLDPRVLAFTTVLTAVTALLFGLGPALRTARVDGSGALLALSRTGGGSRLTAARLSVVAQVAMSVVLVGAAVLLTGTLWHLRSFDPGFHRQGVLLVNVDAERAHLAPEALRSAYRAALRRLRADPAVRAATVVNIPPLSGASMTQPVVPDAADPDGGAHQVYSNDVGDGYFETSGTRLVDGHGFSEDDAPGTPSVVVVNETLARQVFGTLEVVGRTLRTRRGEREFSLPFRIVGLVRDAKYTSLRDPEPPTAYFALFQRKSLYHRMTFQVLLARPAATLAGHEGLLPPSVSHTLAAIGPDVRLQVDTLAALIDETLAQERMLAVLSALFGAAALFLCAIGLHGVVSYGVVRRTHEIAVRTALGASRASVLRLVMLDAGRLVSAGALLGVAACILGRRLIDSFAYGISPADPRPLAMAVALLLAIAWLSCLSPARRAAQSDPIEALRAD